VGVFDRFFGKSDVRAARRAELRGDLAKAVEMYGLAGAPGEAARVMILRGDAETDVRVRMRHYTQAVATAPEGHPVRDEARRKRAALLVAQFGGAATSETARRELRSAATELLDLGDAKHAAEAFRFAGDAEGEAKALTQAGDVESLELLLGEQQMKERAELEQKNVHGEIEMLVASGRRREALAAAERWLETHDDPALRDQASRVRGFRALGPIAQVWLRGKATPIVLGDEIVVGRTEGTLQVPSHAVSRRHVRIAREGGAVVVRDLGSRNGTQLRGMDIAGAIPVPASGDEGLDLTLGKEVRVRVSPSTLLEGAVAVEIGGATYVAPLGPARIAVSGGAWELRVGDAGWIELVTRGAPAYLRSAEGAGDVSLADPTTLLVGDVIASERGGPEVLRVVGE
jgi:hypothetical protein